MEIVGNRDDVLKLWPPVEMTATRERAETAETAIAKPADIPPLVWAVVLMLDNMERENPTGLAGLTQEQRKERVNAKLPRPVSRRTLQKAEAVRRKRSGPH